MRLIGSGPWTLMAPKSVAPLKLTAVSAVALFCCKNCLAVASSGSVAACTYLPTVCTVIEYLSVPFVASILRSRRRCHLRPLDW